MVLVLAATRWYQSEFMAQQKVNMGRRLAIV